MRIRKLMLRGFQSHVDSTISFSTGLNVIIGSSNNGKSSIVRALRSLFYNDWSKSYVTTGHKISEIEVELEDGTTIKKTKGSGVNKLAYTTSNKSDEFSGFGDNVPSEIIKLIGCGPIILDEDKKFFINIANQHDPIFLLNDSGSFKSKVLGYISGIHILDSATREVGNDIRNEQMIQQSIAQELKRLEAKISEFDAVEEKKKKRDELYTVIKEQEKIRARLNELNGLYGQVIAYNQRCELLRGKIQRLNSISEEKMTEDFVNLMLAFGTCPVCGSAITKDNLTIHSSHE